MRIKLVYYILKIKEYVLKKHMFDDAPGIDCPTTSIYTAKRSGKRVPGMFPTVAHTSGKVRRYTKGLR